MINTVIKKGLMLSKTTNWMKLVTILMILMDIKERYIIEKKRRFDQYILNKKAHLIANTFKSSLINIVLKKNNVKDLERTG
jgi:hypothetical protein